jgi:acyl carrier protein
MLLLRFDKERFIEDVDKGFEENGYALDSTQETAIVVALREELRRAVGRMLSDDEV